MSAGSLLDPNDLEGTLRRMVAFLAPACARRHLARFSASLETVE